MALVKAELVKWLPNGDVSTEKVPVSVGWDLEQDAEERQFVVVVGGLHQVRFSREQLKDFMVQMQEGANLPW